MPQITDFIGDFLLDGFVDLIETVIGRIVAQRMYLTFSRDEDVGGFNVQVDELHRMDVSEAFGDV